VDVPQRLEKEKSGLLEKKKIQTAGKALTEKRRA